MNIDLFLSSQHKQRKEKSAWDLLLPLENEPYARRFLKKKYQHQGIDHPERAAFFAGEPLVYYLRQAREIYETVAGSSLLVQPLIAYYGMINLIKVWILTIDPSYPNNTSVLRHGLSTRRRKGNNYSFAKDEVRVQREGLFPLTATLLGQKNMEGNTYSSKFLLSEIPELQKSYQEIFQETTYYPVFMEDSLTNEDITYCYIQESILDTYHLTENAFITWLNRHRLNPNHYFTLNQPAVTKGYLTFLWVHPSQFTFLEEHPFFRKDMQGGIYLFTGKHRPVPLPEILIHYMLLFSLSMLSRYEPPIWGEIALGFGSEEVVLIRQFLQLTLQKFPQLILQLLCEEWNSPLHQFLKKTGKLFV